MPLLLRNDLRWTKIFRILQMRMSETDLLFRHQPGAGDAILQGAVPTKEREADKADDEDQNRSCFGQ